MENREGFLNPEEEKIRLSGESKNYRVDIIEREDGTIVMTTIDKAIEKGRPGHDRIEWEQAVTRIFTKEEFEQFMGADNKIIVEGEEIEVN